MGSDNCCQTMLEVHGIVFKIILTIFVLPATSLYGCGDPAGVHAVGSDNCCWAMLEVHGIIFKIIVAIIVLPATSLYGCGDPAGVHAVGSDNCYVFHSSQSLSWQDAYKYCKDR